jgi:arylsulfatase A-like enzyme
MLTGVSVAKHGVDWNGDRPAGIDLYPRVPTLFEVARKAGFTTAMAAGKSKFVALVRPDTLDWSFLPNSTKCTDNTVADQAVAMIREHQPGVLFVHFPDTDTAGHASGWGSPEQLKAIENADAQIARVIEAIGREHLTDKTLVIVSADHGGAGLNHGPGDPRSRHIPWVAAGPDVRENFDLTRLDQLTVHTEDTFATACWFLGIPLAAYVEGKPINQIAQPAGEARRTEPAVQN